MSRPNDSYITCPACLSLNAPEALVCRQCGTPLPPDKGKGSSPKRPSTLFLTTLWVLLGPGVLMPLFWLAPRFFAATGTPSADRIRIFGSIAYFLISVLLLVRVSLRYRKKSTP